MALSNVLVDGSGNIFFDDCECSSRCCCFVWDLERKAGFSSESHLPVLAAFRGKPDFMKLIVNHGYFRCLPEESHDLKEEIHKYIFSFIWTVTRCMTNIDSRIEAVMDLIKNYLFHYTNRTFYKRIFLTAVAVQATLYQVHKEMKSAEDYIDCLRIYFRATSDPLITIFEVRSFFYACFFLENKLHLFDKYCQEFHGIMPECAVEPEPRKLTDLVCFKIRKILNSSKLPLPEAAEKLSLPKTLKRFLLGDILGKK